LSDTTIGCFIRLFFWIAACIMRAIWSEAPSALAATTILTGLVGSQAATAGALTSMTARAAAVFSARWRSGLLISQYRSTPLIGSVRVKNMLGDIQTDYVNL
jgi:hypothetical protein